MYANHVALSNGSTIIFVDKDNNIVSRTVVAQRQVPNTDIEVAELDSDVPSSIVYYPLVDLATLKNYWKTVPTTPIIFLDQNDTAFMQEITSINSDGTLNHGITSTSPRSNFYQPAVDHDSGNPIFTVIGGQLVLVSSVHYATNNVFYPSYLSQINSAMTYLDSLMPGLGHTSSTYQASTIDLSCFTPQATPTFNSSSYTFSVNENSDPGTEIGQVEATGGNGVLAYSITSGNNNNFFLINPTTGDISINTHYLDYETTPTYTLTVQVENADPWYWPITPVDNVTTSVTVNLLDVPDSAESPPTVAGVAISGYPYINQVLTGGYTYINNSEEDPPEGVSIFQWYRNGEPIDGATSKTYYVSWEDLYTTITFGVTPVSQSGVHGSPVLSAGLSIIDMPLTPTAVSVQISGNLVVGQNLTGSYTIIWDGNDGGYHDASTFKWYRDGVPINGATSKTYVVTTRDIGPIIKFGVKPKMDNGQDLESGIPVQSSGLSVTAIFHATNVTISGDPIVGQTLTGEYTYVNDSGINSEGASTFQWYRTGGEEENIPIEGATSKTYTLTSDDADNVITFEVTPVSQSEIQGPPAQSIGIIVFSLSEISPPYTTTVYIDNYNGPYVGETLNGEYDYNDDSGVNHENGSTFKWCRDGVPITNATSQSYLVTSSDLHESITFEVTLVGKVFSADPVTSDGVDVIDLPPPYTGFVGIDGEPYVGQTLIGTYEYLDDSGVNPESGSTYRWYRDGEPIPNATSINYLITSGDLHKTLVFEVTLIGELAQADPVTSDGRYINTTPIPDVDNVAISGDLIVGRTLTGSYHFNDNTEGIYPEYNSLYQWYRNNDPITDAITTSYTLTSNDAGTTIYFEVTPANILFTQGFPVKSEGLFIPLPEAPTISSILITTPANKLSYTIGDALDISGLVVTGTYSDSSTQVETITSSNITGFNSSAPSTGQVLTITYGGKTTTYTINIIAVSHNGGGGGGGRNYFPPVTTSPVINSPLFSGCSNRTTGFSTTTGKSCVGNTITKTTYNFGITTLKNGSIGNAVKELQRFLNANLKMNLIVDGKLGPKTIAIIKQWQKAHGLTPDGLIGAKTKEMMNEEAK